MYRIMGGVAAVVVLGLSARDAGADIADEGLTPTSETGTSTTRTFHARAGGGVAPVMLRSTDHLPTAHHGIGAFVTAFVQLPYRLSLGAGFEWERYSYETTTHEDYTKDHATFPEEELTHSRVLGVLQWDFLERGVNPFVLGVAGMGWERATKTDWQCTPNTMSGPVVGGGAGVDLAVAPWLVR